MLVRASLTSFYSYEEDVGTYIFLLRNATVCNSGDYVCSFSFGNVSMLGDADHLRPSESIYKN